MKKKMLLIVIISLSVTVAIVVSVLAGMQQRSIVRTFAKQESTLLQFARSNIEIGLETKRLDAVRNTLSQLQDYSIFECAVIFDTEFTPILSIPPEFELSTPLQQTVLETGRFRQDYLTYVSTVLNDQDGDLLGDLLIGFTYVEMEKETRTALLYAILVGVIILLPVLGILFKQSGDKDDTVWFAVSDNGPGIPEEHLTNIFEPFFTTKAKMDEQDVEIPSGTGLGLYSCWEIVNAYGGQVGVSNNEDSGAKFTVVLPRLELDLT